MVNTVSYYTNVLGEQVSTATVLSDMIANLQTRVQKGESNLTDVNIGSELRNVFEANSEGIFRLLRENDLIGRMLSVRQATGGYLDDRGYEVGLYRKNGTYSNGTVTFSIPSPLRVDYTIFAGTTLLNSKTGYRYVLVGDATILAGDTWTTGLVQAEATGEEYNCKAHTITAFETGQDVRSDLSVDNDADFTNGETVESDIDFRRRVLNSMRGGTFGSWEYYRSICENVDGVHDVNFVKPEKLNAITSNRHTILNSNNAPVECNSCTAVCVVNPETNDGTSEEVLLTIANLLTNQHNIVLGHEFHVQRAIEDKYYFSISYIPESGYTVTENEVYECLNTLFNGGVYSGKEEIEYLGFEVSETVSKATIIDALENIEGLHHVESIKLLGWHASLYGVTRLEKWINDNQVYGATPTNKFVYTDIKDYPDEDDVEMRGYQSDYPVPVWKFVEVTESGESKYELVVDGYYFYKIKDNKIEGDNNEGEHAEGNEDDYWFWGEKYFDEIVVHPDCVARCSPLSSLDGGTHFVKLIKRRENGT